MPVVNTQVLAYIPVQQKYNTDNLPKDWLQQLYKIHDDYIFSINRLYEKGLLKNNLPKHLQGRKYRKLNYDNLKLIYVFLNKPSIPHDKKNSVLEMLCSNIENCLDGYADILLGITQNIMAPDNIFELIHKFKRSLVETAALNYDLDVHNHNSFFKVAKKYGFGIEVININDAYGSSLTEQQIKALITQEFSRSFSFFSVLKHIINETKILLHTYGYINDNDEIQSGKHSEIINIITKYFWPKNLIGDDQESLFTDDYVKLNWSNINVYLLNSLLNTRLFTLTSQDEIDIFEKIKTILSYSTEENTDIVLIINDDLLQFFTSANDFNGFMSLFNRFDDKLKIALYCKLMKLRPDYCDGLLPCLLKLCSVSTISDDFTIPGLNAYINSPQRLSKCLQHIDKEILLTIFKLLRPFIFYQFAADALIYSCSRGYLNAVKNLIALSVNVNQVGSHGIPPITASRNHPNVTAYLIECGALIDPIGLFKHALSKNHVEVISILFRKQYLNINSIIDNKINILDYILCIKNDAFIIPLLNQLSALNQEYLNHFFRRAVYSGQSEAVLQTLITKGADLNAINCLGLSSIFFAVNRNSLRMVNFLLNNGANINIVDKQGKSIFHYTSNHEIRKVLFEHGRRLRQTGVIQNPVQSLMCNPYVSSPQRFIPNRQNMQHALNVNNDRRQRFNHICTRLSR